MNDCKIETAFPPKAFLWRRLHSLMGIWLSAYLFFHLFTNSQAGLLIGDDGRGFIHAVNSIYDMPYLPVLEFLVLGIPILVHLVWGLKYLKEASFNTYGNNGKTPYLPEYTRNHAYTWQRITAAILVVGLIAHIIHMRFLEHPISVKKDTHEYFLVKVNLDPGIYTLAYRLNFQLLDHNQIQLQKDEVLDGAGKNNEGTLHSFFSSMKDIFQGPEADLPVTKPKELIQEQKKIQDKEFVKALERRKLKKGQAIVVASDFGTAELIMLRETFKMPIMLVLYTLFVIVACYHAFNGLWTFLIKWGITLTPASQHLFIKISWAITILVSFMGLAAIWSTYWINLKS